MSKFHIYVQNNIFKQIMTSLRLGILNLQNQKGRWTGTQRDERICKFCNHNLVEDEFHFILQCPYYKELRQKSLQSLI